MKARSFFVLTLLVMLAVILENDHLAMAKRSSSSSKSSSYKGYSGYSGGSKTTTTTTTSIRKSNGSYFSGSPVYVNYGTYRPSGWFVGVPYYDSYYRYYYDGQYSYKEVRPAGPLETIFTIIVVIIIICCALIGKSRGVNIDGDDHYEEVITTTTTTVVEEGGPPQGQTYAPGTNPPGTFLCNAGHIFAFMTTNPYGDDTSTCDNCQQIVNFGYGGYHCPICEVDLCKNCGDQRVQQSQQQQPGMMMGQPGMMPPDQMMGQPGMMQPGQMQPGMMQPGQMQPGMMPPGQMMQPGMMQPGQMQPGMMQPGQMQPGMMQPGQMQPGMMPPQQQWQQ